MRENRTFRLSGGRRLALQWAPSSDPYTSRGVSFSQGFDAAAWGEIAPKARVPKGTLYVYFDSKERLFEAIAHEECGLQTEAVFSLDQAIQTSNPCSTGVGCSFVKFLCLPGSHVAVAHVIASSGPHAGDRTGRR